jgi:hypothetical protein
MRIFQGFAAFLIFIAVKGPAFAVPATPQQADKIAASLQAYFSSEPGVVTITPSGEAYDLKLDFNPLFAKSKKQDFKGEMSAFNMKLADQGGGKWQVTQDESVTFKFTFPGADMSGAIVKLKGSSVYDETLGAFSGGTSDFTDFSFEQTTEMPGQPASRSSVKMNKGHYETFATAAASGGIDGTVKMSIEGLIQEITTAVQPGAPPTPVIITAEKVTQDSEMKGTRMQPLQKLFVWAIANSGAPDINSKQPELKKLLADALPVFDNIKGNITYQNVNVETPMGPVGLASANVLVDMNGFVANGQLSETFTLEGLTLPPGLVPPFATDLVPQKLIVDFKIADFNLADATRIFLEQVDFASKADLPPELSAKLLTAILPSGAVTISTSGTSVLSKIYDLKADGLMKAGPAGKPSGSAVVKLKGFDEIVKALQSAPADLGLQQSIGGLVVAKGLAKPEGDLLSWTVESTPDGGVLINGVDLSKMGGGGG